MVGYGVPFLIVFSAVVGMTMTKYTFKFKGILK